MILKIAGIENQLSQDVLAADIGATKTNVSLCHWDGHGFTVTKEASYKTKNFTDVVSLIETFIEKEPLPAKICLAVAGPVQNRKASLTNINWTIDAGVVEEEFKRKAFLMNDLEAVAYGLGVMDKKDIHVLHEGEEQAGGNVVIIAPGTGLGEAGLFYEEGYHPVSTEGGHASFSPRAEIDIELYRYLVKKFEHVSWERLISGPGICDIYDFLVHVKEREEPAWIKEKMLLHDKAVVISENATECEVCKETMDLFVRYLAEECGNLVLKYKATGGVFIGGGIVPEMIPIIHDEYFLKQFSNFGRFRNFLQSVPVCILLNKKAPVLGAAYSAVLLSESADHK